MPPSSLTLLEAINHAAHLLSAKGVANARLDAEVLLARCVRQNRAWLITHIHDALEVEQWRRFEEAVQRRAAREPLQYILGSQEFWGLDFVVTADVLIPRPETELVVEAALGIAPEKNRPLTIADLCTGSGCIAISLARELSGASIVATDNSAKALAVARRNAERHGAADRIRFFVGDLFMPLERLDIRGRIDIIVSNPPYIPAGDYRSLQAEVRDYEPETALLAGPEGTDFHKRIIDEAPFFLRSNGALVMEMGIGQADMLDAMMRENGTYESIAVLKDLAGIARVIVARKKEAENGRQK